MTDYKAIVGKGIKVVSTNLDNAEAEGQIWFNSTTGEFIDVVNIEAWASAAPQTQNQRDGGYGQSTPSSASWFAGGVDSSRNSTTTQEWNGSGWSNGGNINVGREEITGFGLVNAAALAGGSTYPPSALKNEVEEYDGSSWTAVTALPAKRKQAAGAGTQTAGLVSFGAVDPPAAAGSISATALEYDGSSWTSGGTGNTARSQISGCGTQTAALAFGGHTSPSTTFPGATEEYDGSSWTTSGVMNTGRGLMAGNGIQTSALAYAGFPPYRDLSEKYDGTTWSNTPTLATARDRAHGGGPNSSNGLCAGGLTSPGVVSVVEEFTSSTNVITAAVFATGGTANTARRQMGYTTNSPQNDFMGYGGFSPGGFINNSETYDGTSWSEGNNLNESKGQLAGAGESSSAALAFGGNGNNANTEEYNGTSWSEQNNMNTGRYELGGAGTQTAGLAVAGESASSGTTTLTEHYNGTSWTTSGTMNTARRENDAAGTQTAAIVAGGGTPSAIANTETYNGSSWTSVNSKITASVAPRTMGGPTSQTAAITNGGQAGSGGFTSTEQWNGTNFVTGPNMNQQRFSHTAGGSISAGIVAFGDAPTPAMLKTSEEFTGESSALNIKTVDTTNI